MGCGTIQHVTIPSKEPKWSDDSLPQEQDSPPPINFLISDSCLFTLNSNLITRSSVVLPNKESGYLVLSPSQILIAGGYNVSELKESSSCYLLSTQNLALSHFAALPNPTRRLRLLTHGSITYSLGGVREVLGKDISLDYTKNFCYFFEGHWKSLPDIPDGVEYPACHGWLNKIYVAGGCVVDSLDLLLSDFVQVFDTSSRQWSVSSIKIPKGLYGCVTVPKDSSTFLLLGGVDSVGDSNSMCYIVSHSGLEEICPISLEVSTFFPYSLYYDDKFVYTLNDKQEVLCLFRFSREWKVVL